MFERLVPILAFVMLSLVHADSAAASGRIPHDLISHELGPMRAVIHRDSELLPVMIGGKWGFIDSKGRMAIEARFDEVKAFVAGAAAVRTGQRWGAVAAGDRVLIPPMFEDADIVSEGMMAVKAENGWTYVSMRQAAMAVRERSKLRVGERAWGHPNPGPSFDAGQYEGLGAFHDGFGVGRRWEGKTPQDTFVTASLEEWAPGVIQAKSGFAEGLAAAMLNGDPNVTSIIDVTGKKLGTVRGVGRVLPFSSGLAAAERLGTSDSDPTRWGYIDRTGAWVIPARFTDARSFQGGVARVKTETGWVFLDRTGVTAIQASYQYAGDFWGGFAAVCSRPDRCGFIDAKGRVALALEHQFAIAHVAGAFLVGVKDPSGRARFSYLRRDGRALWSEAFTVAAP